MPELSNPADPAVVDRPPRGRSLLRQAAIMGVILVGSALAGYLLWKERNQTAQPADLGPAFSYDLETLRQVDPKWIGYHEIAPVATDFQVVRGMALAANGSLWVAGDRAVRRYNRAGQRQAEIPLEAEPRCLALDGDRLFIGMGATVLQADVTATSTVVWKRLEAPAQITALAVRGEVVLLADSGRRRVLRCDRQGAVLNELGGRDPATGRLGLVLPSPYLDVDGDADGRIYVNNPGRHQIETFSADGDFIDAWGQASMRIDGFSGCCNPVAVLHLADGRTVTSEKGLARVKLHAADGTLQCLVAAPRTFSETGFGIDLATDADGRMYVLDTGTRSVRVFEANPREPQP